MPGASRIGIDAFRVRECRERVDEDVIILLRLIMQVISADAKIERSREMRCQAKFLAGLPGMFFRQIFGKDLVAAAKLGIAKNAVGIGVINCHTAFGTEHAGG